MEMMKEEQKTLQESLGKVLEENSELTEKLEEAKEREAETIKALHLLRLELQTP
jgi:hypothetical protein